MSLLLTALLVGAAFLGGVWAGQRTKADPRLYWGFLGGGLVLTTALMVGGYTWYDELFLLGLLLADPPRWGSSKTSPKGGVRWTLFTIFCVYAMVEGVRGLFFFAGADDGALQKFRWILFFGLILAAAAKGKQLSDDGVKPVNASSMITRAGATFTAVYGGLSLVAFLTVGSFAGTQFAQLPTAPVNPFLAVFGATAYVTCIYMVVVPAALVCLGSDERGRAWLGAMTLILVLTVQVALNSRTGMLFVLVAVLIYLVSRLATARLRLGELMLIPLLMCVPVIVTAYGESDLDKVVNDLARTLHLSDEATTRQDIDRRIWFSSSFYSLNNSDPLHALTGYGLRTSGYVVAPYVTQRFYSETGRLKTETDVSVEGFTAIAVDMGYVGLGLFLFIVFGGVITALRGPGGQRFILVLVPAGMFFVTLVANVFDCAVLYLAIMPLGLAYSLTGREDDTSQEDADVLSSASIARSGASDSHLYPRRV